MKRRTFIALSAASVTMLAAPVLVSCDPKKDLHQTLSQPQALGHLCDEKGILEIGKAYVKQVPGESSIDTLTNLLLTDNTGKIISADAEKSVLQAMLNQKITDDFSEDRTIIVNGWVLSVTEARQCAIYSLIQ